MPHTRERYGKQLVRKALTFSPVVGVIGQRQVGKTTLAEELCAEYSTFDSAEVLRRATKEPDAFLKGRKSPFAIDECQLCPPLFPAIKDHVRTHPRKGQFILTGSVRFTSRKAIKESLTGRISNVEFLPFTLSEAHQKPLSNFCIRVLESASLKTLDRLLAGSNPTPWCTMKKMQEYLLAGGLPGICFNRVTAIRFSKWSDHLDTLLDRDLRLIIETTISLSNLHLLLETLAEIQGEPLDIARLSRKTRISRVTLPRLLYALEGIFLIRRYLSRGGLSAPVIYFEDQGMLGYLKRQETIHELSADDMGRLVHSCILPQFRYRPELLPEFSVFRTRGGASVPFVVRTSHGILGLIPDQGDEGSAGTLGSARSFLRSYPKAKIVILTNAKAPRIISLSLLEIPINWML